VTDLLPERDRDMVRSRMRAAWALTDAELAQQRLELLACELDRTSVCVLRSTAPLRKI
jgi:hypothetical protein